MQKNTSSQIETKASYETHMLQNAFEDFMESFEAFRQTNDERLDRIESGKSVDSLTEEKLARIDKAIDANKDRLDQLVLKSHRPALSGRSHAHSVHALEHKSQFENYMRSGTENGLHTLEQKAMQAGVDADGGYLVPEEMEASILTRLTELSPIRSIAGIREVSSAVYKRPVTLTGPASGWVSETGARTQTNSATLTEVSFPTMELYAMPAATASLLEDSVVDLDAWIAAEVDTAFSEQENAAFVNGDGTNKPRGFLNYETVAQSSWAWGKIGTLLTGVDGALPTTNPSDKLIDLVYSLKAGYRQNASWVMNRKTQAAIRKLKDSDGNYLWQPPAAPGTSASFMNFPLVETEDMPDIDDDSLSIAFGDFRRGYLIVDRAGVRLLRDPYSAKPYVLFYVTKRVGGGVLDFDAIKLLKFAAS